jgi:molecular chaperone DnaK
MARTKIDYGIDLGTTNSGIARMENGEPVIKKTLDDNKDTMPSCVAFTKKSVLVGDPAFRSYRSERQEALSKGTDFNSFIEFKRTMGTDKKYFSSKQEKDFTSEELSSEILKKLKSFIQDEQIKSIVITVPAKFTMNQKDATTRAAKLAGFEHCELLQEPIAASMAYGLDAKSQDGLWLVFDFGGGTFDAALLKVEDGIMKVIDTEGDNYLGGKNLDYVIVDEIIIPYLSKNYSMYKTLNDPTAKEVLRDVMKFYAESIKNQLSFNDSFNLYIDPGDIGIDDNGEEIEVDITVTKDDLSKTLTPTFQKAITICNELLKRNHLNGSSLGALILVGGPTYSPILRKMLKEQVTEKVDTSCDPMTVVAKGAALYASTVNVSDEIIEKNRDKSKIQLDFGYEPTWVGSEQLVTIKYLRDKTMGLIPDKVFAEVVRGDKAWSSGKIQIDELGEVVEVKFVEGKPNLFNVFIYNVTGDLIPSEPNQFTIIEGTKVGSATLPYNIGIEIKSKASGKIVFRLIKGLEKNQTTPATGIENGLKTQKQINPGSKSDFIKIPIYQGDYGSEGSRAIYNEHVFDVIISGEQLPSLLPEGSDVDLTLKVDKSERVTISAFFPYLNFTEEVVIPETVQKEIDAKWLETEISKAKQTLNIIKQEGDFTDKDSLNKLSNELAELEKLLEQGRSDYDRKKQIIDNLRRSLRKLDDIQDSTEWPKTEEELKDAFYKLEETFKQFEGKVEGLNEDRIKEAISQFKEQIPQIIRDKNVKVAKELTDLMRGLSFTLVDQALGAQMEIMMLKEFNDEFDMHDWSDRNKAKMLISQGMQIAATNPSKQRLRPIVIELYKLLPGIDKPIFAGDDSVLTD